MVRICYPLWDMVKVCLYKIVQCVVHYIDPPPKKKTGLKSAHKKLSVRLIIDITEKFLTKNVTVHYFSMQCGSKTNVS